MKRSVEFSVVMVLALALVSLGFPVPTEAQVFPLIFEGGIGVIPVSSGVGQDPTAEVVNRNIVRGVQPAGQIWVISDLSAVVEADGRIRVDGEGLLLGGGNNIGTNAGASVFATLICERVAPFTERNTEDVNGVALEANGDFRIDDMLTPAPPEECASPVLLIRNVSNRAWFAAGIPEAQEMEM